MHIYPVKSCRGIRVDDWPVDERGLRHDRRFMVARPDGTFVTQREVPALALVGTALDEAAGSLTLSHPTAAPLVLPLHPPPGAEQATEVWGDAIRARRVAAHADAWLTTALGEPLVLLHFPDDEHRATDPAWAPGFQTGFADGYPLLVVGQASLDDLNGRLPAPVPMDRFRPNLVVDGSAPFAEDGWRDLTIGDVGLRVVKPCARCAIVTTDQQTAVRSQEPLRTLATYRRRGHDVMFGQNAVVTRTGRLRIGDQISA